MSGQSYDGHGGFVRQSNRMPKTARPKGGIPNAKTWVGKPSKKSKMPVGPRNATSHPRAGATSPVQKKPGC